MSSTAASSTSPRNPAGIPVRRSSRFQLSKWYLDCVDAAGNTFIGYSADLRWRMVRLPFAAGVVESRDTAGAARYAFRPHTPPLQRSAEVRWDCDRVRVTGTWIPLTVPIEIELYRSDAGKVVWQCLVPGATATVSIAGHSQLQGFGYVERLELTLPPWALPLDELRWGRFVSPEHTLAWITWTGERPLSVAVYNGRVMQAASVTEARVLFPEAECRLDLTQTRHLRATDDALTRWPIRALTRLGGKRFTVGGRKSVSRAALEVGGVRRAAAWAIHELVTFR